MFSFSETYIINGIPYIVKANLLLNMIYIYKTSLEIFSCSVGLYEEYYGNMESFCNHVVSMRDGLGMSRVETHRSIKALKELK